MTILGKCIVISILLMIFNEILMDFGLIKKQTADWLVGLKRLWVLATMAATLILLIIFIVTF